MPLLDEYGMFISFWITYLLNVGKTLAYLLPILQFFLKEEEETEEKDLVFRETFMEDSVLNSNNRLKQKMDDIKSVSLTALILCPTRELALQVSNEFEKISRKAVACGTIVGGLSEEKQKRVLDVKRPPVLVATPGRLWSLVR